MTEDVSSVIADLKNQASLLKIFVEEEKSRNLSLTLEVDSLKTNLEKVAKEKESEIQLKDVAITDLKNELKLKVEAANTAENEHRQQIGDMKSAAEMKKETDQDARKELRKDVMNTVKPLLDWKEKQIKVLRNKKETMSKSLLAQKKEIKNLQKQTTYYKTEVQSLNKRNVRLLYKCSTHETRKLNKYVNFDNF